MQERTIMCPILKKQIDDTICYDIHMNGCFLTGEYQRKLYVYRTTSGFVWNAKIIRSKCHRSKWLVVFLYQFLRKRGRATWKMKNF